MENDNQEQISNESKQVATTTSQLTGKELQTIQMRYLGKSSVEIAEATGYNESHVRRLFMNGGRLEKAYEDFALEQQQKGKETVALATNRAREEALQAIERIIALSKDADNEAALFKANEFLLSIAGVRTDISLKSLFSGENL